MNTSRSTLDVLVISLSTNPHVFLLHTHTRASAREASAVSQNKVVTSQRETEKLEARSCLYNYALQP
jgi:hypothetical protein